MISPINGSLLKAVEKLIKFDPVITELVNLIEKSKTESVDLQILLEIVNCDCEKVGLAINNEKN